MNHFIFIISCNFSLQDDPNLFDNNVDNRVLNFAFWAKLQVRYFELTIIAQYSPLNVKYYSFKEVFYNLQYVRQHGQR